MRLVLRLTFLLVLLGISTSDAEAQQTATEGGHINAGVAVIPGVGLHAAYVQPRALYTMEGALYVDFSPSFAGGEGSIQLSGGLGGALRIFGIMRAIGNPPTPGTDLDFGFRLGPALFFPLGESSRSENPFSLFMEPFGRFSTELAEDRIAFVELGLQRPILRAGVIIDF